MKCIICGKPSGKYYFCVNCNKLKDEGKIVKCDQCGKWHKSNEKCSCSVSQKDKEQTKTCIVCGKDAPKGSLCSECYYEMKDFKESFDKNAKLFEMKDYYFNLRSSIYRMKTFDYVKSNCNKLFAIANFVKEICKDSSLVDRAENDIVEIITSKKPQQEVVVTEEVKAKDSHREELLRACDGHYVKSDPEVVIDDMLYELRVVHCYEKKVPIDCDEKAIKCDWFIPILNSRSGIYIEYWGMNTKDYLANKERKRKAYKEHDIPLIEIEKDDYKEKGTLSDRLISEINKLAKKYYNVIDFIK